MKTHLNSPKHLIRNTSSKKVKGDVYYFDHRLVKTKLFLKSQQLSESILQIAFLLLILAIYHFLFI